MLTNARTLLLLLFFFLATTASAAESAAAMLAKQEEILQQLAEEGVWEANHVLGRFYEFNEERNPRFLSKARLYYSRSAQQGHSKSLYWLGHYLLGQQNLNKRLEGLVSLCESAILGERRAQVDLVMIPRFYGNLTPKEIEKQCTIARQRLKSGNPIDCHIADCGGESASSSLPLCPHCAEKAARFELAWQNSGAPSMDRFFRRRIQYFSLITPDQIKRYRQAIFIDNQRIDILNRQKAAKHPAKAQLAQQQINKQLVQEDLARDLARLKPKIQALLDKINQHRTPESRLSIEQVSEQLEKRLTSK